MKSSDYGKYTDLFRSKKENGETFSGTINASFVPLLVNKQFHNYEVSKIIEDKNKSDETVRFNRFGLGSMTINGNSEYSNNPDIFGTSDGELNRTMRKTFEITLKNLVKEFDHTFFPAPYTYSKDVGVIKGGTRVDISGEIDLFDRKNPQPKRQGKKNKIF